MLLFAESGVLTLLAHSTNPKLAPRKFVAKFLGRSATRRADVIGNASLAVAPGESGQKIVDCGRFRCCIHGVNIATELALSSGYFTLANQRAAHRHYAQSHRNVASRIARTSQDRGCAKATFPP